MSERSIPQIIELADGTKCVCLEDFLRERDEAIAQAHNFEQGYHIHSARADEAIRERNEAQENLRILAGLVAYGLGQSGEEWSLEAMRQATAAIQKAKALEGEK